MKRNDRYLQRLKGEDGNTCKNNFVKIFTWIIIFSITLSLYGIESVAREQDGLCEHHPKHTDACGYEASGGTTCNFDCKDCSNKEGSDAAPDTVKTISSWKWVDADEVLVQDDTTGVWGLGLPGANEENKVTSDVLSELLPAEITATLADGSTETISITWNYDSLPEGGAAKGSYTLTAALPDGYALAKGAPELSVLLELGGGSVYDSQRKFVNQWSFVLNRGKISGNGKEEGYTLDLYLPSGKNSDELKEAVRQMLPDKIKCWTSGRDTTILDTVGFHYDAAINEDGTEANGKKWDKTSIMWGTVDIGWREDEIPRNPFQDEQTYTLHADARPNAGHNIYVNSNVNGGGSTWPDDSNYNPDVIELKVIIHDLNLEDHIVPSVNPLNTKVNLFDYWVDTDGAKGNDLLDKNDVHNNIPRTGVSDWNKGINVGRLLLFGDGNIHAGFWNKGAGASSDYGKSAAGMMGIVKPTLNDDGYPVIDEDELRKQMSGYEGISDWNLCGNHTGTDQPQNVSSTVIDQWDKNASLDYLFDPEETTDYRRVYKDAEGLFQLDNNGYYYYDMRRNFAEYDEQSGRFVLYDAPAVERTDASYENGGFTGGRSVGNFFPFNKGKQVFDVVENGKLSSSEAIKSHNEKTRADDYMNHHLGMTVNIDFRQPLNGTLNTGTATNVPMTFQFSGDDDVWIFIDDVLVLDLGGIHSEVYGTIDFESGAIKIGQSWKSNGFPYNADGTVDESKLPDPVFTTTLNKQFTDAGKAGTTQWNGDTFASNTSHTLKMFYLERGNYDSSLALRFNLQPLLYQQIKKVDQQGQPVEDVQFDLYPAEVTTKNAKGAIECLYTDNAAATQNEFYVKQKEGESKLVSLVTKEDGTAQFLDENHNYFNFADRGKQYYILKESKTLDGYRSQPVGIVLYYDPDVSMLSVANRWTTGAYACSVVNIIGAGGLTYGMFDDATGNIVQDPNSASLDADRQMEGLAVAIPLLKKRSNNTWEALYGSNLNGFTAFPIESSNEAAWKNAVLRAALEQAVDTTNPQWNLSWDTENRRLAGSLSDLPGLANRYLLNNAHGDMHMVYGIIEKEALQKLGISGNTARERYEALGAYVKAHGVDHTLAAITGTAVGNSGTNSGFNFLNSNQFNRDFRSLIYIPNEQRELWVMKIDQNGIPRNGSRFGLYNNERCAGNPVAEGTTATVNGQEGTLIFSPSSDTSPGHAKITWASSGRTHYYLKELSAPDDCTLNSTIIPVVVGTYSIYADAGVKNDGVSVMAGVGRLTQTMRQYAMGNDVDITLRDITAVGQYQPSSNTDVLNENWQDMSLAGVKDVSRSMNLHFGMNAVVDYGLHNEDGGALYKPFFVSDAGFIRARVKQNYEALTDSSKYHGANNDINKDNLGDMDLTNLFSLLNVVVVTDETKQDTDTGKLVISKMLSGPHLSEDDYAKNFQFKLQLTDADGRELPGKYYFYGTDKSGYVSSGMMLPLHHDESITILGLPDGAKYSVSENTEAGWYPLPKSGMVNKGIAANKTVFASFYNSKEAWSDIGFLVLHKTVAGGGDREKEFTFRVTFADENGKKLTDQFSYTGDRNGTVSSGESITLGHDEDVTIFGIPAGTQYTVSEEEADKDGYTTTFLGESGVIRDGEEYMAVYTNYKGQPNTPGNDPGSGSHSGAGVDPGQKNIHSKAPSTGDVFKALGLFSVMLLSVYVAANAYRRRRR